MSSQKAEKLFEEFYESPAASRCRGQFMLSLYEAFVEGYQKGLLQRKEKAKVIPCRVSLHRNNK